MKIRIVMDVEVQPPLVLALPSVLVEACSDAVMKRVTDNKNSGDLRVTHAQLLAFGDAKEVHYTTTQKLSEGLAKLVDWFSSMTPAVESPKTPLAPKKAKKAKK